jgi:DNA-binding transcriptional ArsR family regulator
MSPSHDDVWAALANPTRRRILDVLADGPSTTGAVVAALESDRHVVIQHLRVLRDADLVRVEPRGRERLNHLNPVPLQDAVGRWFSRYEQNWAATLVGLRDTLETRPTQDGIDVPGSPLHSGALGA